MLILIKVPNHSQTTKILSLLCAVTYIIPIYYSIKIEMTSQLV